MGDLIEPYAGGDDCNNDADRVEELANGLSDLLSDIRRRIDATEATRRPIRDREGEIPDFPDVDYPDLEEAQATIARVIDDYRAVSEGLSALADEMRSASEVLDALGD